MNSLETSSRFEVPRWFTPDPAEQFHNPYLAMGNNPVMYVDPDGEFAFLIPFLIGAGISVITNGISNSIHGGEFFDGAGRAALIGGVTGVLSAGIGYEAGGFMGVEKVAFQTLMHGHLGGMTSAVTGGTYTSGFLAGSTGSLAASATGYAMEGVKSNLANGGVVVGSGALMGGISSELSGGNFWDGVRIGAIGSGLNHLAHSVLLASAEVTDEKYQGFSDKRKSRYIRKPKTALVQTDERNVVNTITPGGVGVNVQQKDIIRIIGKRVWVKNSLNTITQTDITSLNMRPLINGWRTASWEVYSYYTSGFYAFQRDINNLLNPSYSNQFNYPNPESYPGGYLSPYMRQFRLGGGFSH